jgi:aminopeptidase N
MKFITSPGESMKKTSLTVAILFLAASPFLAAQRLPELATPENYKLKFAPEFTKDTFSGDETIQIHVLQPTSRIVLNAIQIDFQDVSITAGGVTQAAKVELDKENEQATFSVEKPLAAGPATVHIRYTGILNNELRGFYLGKDPQGRKYAATQFEATDARRAFPCFDEPAYKATFDVTAIADKGMAAISNMKVVSDTPGPEDKHTVQFATTPKMSSYLVALIVGDFEYIEGSADSIPIRVYTHPGEKQLGTFALEVAEHAMDYYNHYFNIKYPYGKLDFVALADFSAGAMENTGCITSREVLLLTDDKNGPIDLKKDIAVTITHEMAHQWFGDLVTMRWWDDIWLNEGFATWMSSKPLEAWKPEWQIELTDINNAAEAMNADSLINTHPIHQEAQTPQQILELADEITYDKTAAVLRMLESYLGPETFRDGVNGYLKQHAYANATAADFWSAQAQVSKKPVDKIMATFVEQPGLPLVDVKAECAGKSEKVMAAQQRYFYDRAKFEAGSSELWQIPACLKMGASKPDCVLLTQKQQTVTLKSCGPWVFGNADARGYYHSSYTPEAARALAKDAETQLNPAERIMLLADIWAAVRVDREKIGDFLGVVQGLQAERNPEVLHQMAEQLEYIGQHLVNDADRDSYRLFLRGLLSPIVKDIGWEGKPGENAGLEGERAELMHVLGFTARDPETVNLAHDLAERALNDSASVNRELAYVALQVAAATGDEALYGKVMQRLQNAKTPEAIYTYQAALAAFSDPALLQKTLQLAISSAVRSQDSLILIGDVMRNPDGQKVAWDFVRSHWEEIENIGGAFGGGAIAAATANFCDSAMREQVKDFFATHHEPASERTLKQSLERMNYCVDLKAQQGSELSSWLHGRNSAGE